MNKQEVLLELIELLSEFSVHDAFIPELSAILKNSGQEAKFLAVFRTRLKTLSQYGADAINVVPTQFELLSHNSGGIYSMHADTRDLNIRILYTFLDDGTILLLPFNERSGKRRTDYTSKIPEAISRVQDFQKGGHNDE